MDSYRAPSETQPPEIPGFSSALWGLLPGGAAWLDAQGRIAYLNRQLGEMLGYGAAELLGQPWQKIVAPAWQPPFEAARHLRAVGPGNPAEMELCCKDGRMLPARVSSQAVYQQDEYCGLLLVVDDLSERKQLEAAVNERQQSQRLQLLLARTLQGVGALVTSQAEPGVLLGQLLELLGRAVKYHSAAILLLNRREQFAWGAGIGLDNAEQFQAELAQSGLNQALAQLQAQAIHNLNSGELRQLGIRLAGFPAAESWLLAPLLLQGRMIGLLVLSQREAEAYQETDSEIGLAFAGQAAAAIQTAQLLEAERRARLRAEALVDSAQALGSTLSLDEVLSLVLKQLGRVVNFDSGCVMLVEGNRVAVAVASGYERFGSTAGLMQAHFQVRTDLTVGMVIRSGRWMAITDVRLDNRWTPTSFSSHVRAWLGAPLIDREQVIGLFSLDRVEARSFDEEEIALVQAFGQQAAAAIANARAFEAQEQRTTELLAVRQASLSATASLELAEVLNSVLQSTLRFLGNAHSGQIFLYEEIDGEAQVQFGAALWRDGRREPPPQMPRSDGLTMTVARSHQPMIVSDMRFHPMFSDMGWDGAIVGLPLSVNERVVGVMNITYLQPRTFLESELRILHLLGDQAAIAIENARLYERSATERRHLGLLYELTYSLGNSLDVQAVLQQAITLACLGLGGDVGLAYLYDAEKNRLRLSAASGLPGVGLAELDEQLQLAPGRGLAGKAAQSRRPLRLADWQKEPEQAGAIELMLAAPTTRSVILTPIMDNYRLLGVFCLAQPEAGFFSEDHLYLLKTVSQQVGLALNNIERYQQVESLLNLLAVEQARLESLVEHLPVGVLLVDEQQQVQVANLQARQICQRLNPNENCARPRRLGEFELADIRARSDEESAFEIVVGEPEPLVVEVEARRLGAETQQWVVTLRDVTQERENQERVNRQQRLVTVGQLAAGIAHDFNNILAAIMVYADLLLRDRSQTQESRERLKIIQQQVERASSLIRQILDFSRRSVMEQTRLEMLTFLKEMYRMLGRVLPETIRLRLEAEPGTYTVLADPTRMQQVVMNLTVNARDAMPAGGELILRLQRTPPGESPAGRDEDEIGQEWICLTVEDNGSGIPAEILPHIFDPFFTTKPVGQGTGLGLAQVYGIVQQHGGLVDVSSRPGEGTRFLIYLPALPNEERVGGGESDTAEIDGKGLRLLLVEDDANTRQALLALLRSLNFVVLDAADGLEAVEILKLQAGQVKLLVSDVVMPGMGGIELYQALQEIAPGTPTLLMTGHPLETPNQAVLEKGEVHWLQKPFSTQEFLRLIGEILQL